MIIFSVLPWFRADLILFSGYLQNSKELPEENALKQSILYAPLLRYYACIRVAQRCREYRSGIESKHVAYSDVAAYVG